MLELYNSLLRRWEQHTYFKLPVAEPREINIYVPPPGTVLNVSLYYVNKIFYFWAICVVVNQAIYIAIYHQYILVI